MKKNNFQLLLIGIVLVLLQTFLQYNSELLEIVGDTLKTIKPLIYAVFIAILVSPLVGLLESKTKMSRGLAIGISLATIFIVLSGLIIVVIPNIIKSSVELTERFPGMMSSLTKNAENIIAFLKERDLLFFDPKKLESNLITLLRQNVNNFKNIALGLGVGVAKSLVGLANFFMGLFISLYLLYSKEYFFKFLYNTSLLFTNKKESERIVKFIQKINDIFLKYILGRIITSFVVGVIVFIIMYFSNSPYALLSGVMIGIGNMIPYVGSIVAGFIATFLILLSSPYKIIYLFIAIIIGQTVDGFLIGPKIVAETVGMSSFWTIVAVLLCGNLFGPLGMFFGVPVFVVLKLIYLEFLRKRKKELRIEE